MKDEYINTETEEESETDREEDEEDQRSKQLEIMHHKRGYKEDESEYSRYNYDRNDDARHRNDERLRSRYDDDQSSLRHNETDDDSRYEAVFNFNKTQPKVSSHSIIEKEHIKSNRISTLMNVISNNASILADKKLTNKSSPNKTVRVDFESYEKTIEAINANNEVGDTVSESLLKHIKQHQNGRNSYRESVFGSIQTTSTIITEKSKDLEDDISNSNLETLTVAVLKMLNQLEIKFPGKTFENTKIILQKACLFNYI